MPLCITMLSNDSNGCNPAATAYIKGVPNGQQGKEAPNMTYLTSRTEYGRSVKAVDLPRFVADLAKAFGGAVLPNKSDFADDDQRNGEIAIDREGVKVLVHSVWNDKTKVSLSIQALDHKWMAGNEPSGEDYKTPTIRVSVDRPMKVLVNDITKRLIAPGLAPIAKRKEYQAQLNKSASDLKLWAEHFRARGFNVRLDEGATHGGTLYRNREGEPYLSGEFYPDGRVTFRSVGFSAAQLFKVLAALEIKP